MRCPQCGSPSVFYDSVRGEQICTRCGLVILERISEPELKRQGRRRTCDPVAGEDPTIHDFGLGSQFSIPRDLPPSLRAKLRRMKCQQERSRAERWDQRTLRSALLTISDLCRKLNLPASLYREACLLYRRARARGLTAGRSQSLLCLAVCYLVCKERGYPLREDEFLKLLPGHRPRLKKRLRRFAHLLSRELGIRLQPTPVLNYLDRYASMLGLPAGVRCRARELCVKIRGKSPAVVAGAAIYRAAKEAGYRISLRNLASRTGLVYSSLARITSALSAGTKDDRSRG